MTLYRLAMRPPRALLALFVSSCLASTCLTSAQAQYTVGKVVFNGAPATQQQALEDTVQLHRGQAFSTPDLQAAAQRLSDTGAFDDVQVTLKGAVKAIDVLFTLKPLPAGSTLLTSFDNFFWFTPAELEAGLRQRVPLFGPTLPEAGNLIDATQAALEDILRQRSISAKVNHDVSEPSAERQARVLTFAVSNPRIVVATVHLDGISPEFAADSRLRADRVAGTLLNDGLEHRTTSDRLLLPYLNAGYVTAHIADRKLTPIATSPDKITLELSGTVVPGPKLTVANLTWPGSPELSTAAFASTASLKPGEPASLIGLEKTTEMLAAPYRKEGYADVVVRTTSAIDTSANTISYSFAVEPGEQYRIRSIKVVGLSAEQQADYDRAFAMKAGDPFNPDYILNFFGEKSSIDSLKHDTASYRAERDPAAHLVDVTITVVRGIVAVHP